MSSDELMDTLPIKIADKVEDKDWSQEFIFEPMPCTHKPEALPFEKVDCPKCQAMDREKWLEETLTNISPTKTIKDKNGNTITLQKITVKRGKFDDCIGIQEDFS